ncbi:MAG: RNA polymerase sigma factor [Stenotrophomonas nitritireducens]|uniref:RNA polymerase sigma factor n=1 Tax=Stenotrophomonas nitritireducens TaxID=83617 RepID=A0A9D8KZR5_9GAMM|nr:RNA polymerase sigma factor [Stenotrophomonas nitritireducens]MBN8769318.1 RNA polymerase sigma factor [Stenotrophomonas sp.]MBN8793444.1 RNA polymerase sigma factor [Stenotrophomonas nitritireducens]MBN8799898.1 RNA polymerase sigma factor [Stenotrophomonas nitritireducens]
MTAALAAERSLWLAEHVLPCEPTLRAWLQRRLPVHQDVDDVIQETYAILAALADVSHVRQPRAYVYSVAQSVVLQQLRRAQVVSIEAVAEIERVAASGEEACPERTASSRQELARIGALIDSLPDKCRQAFVLRRVEGYSQREIAQRMQISENTVEKHICKGIRVLMDSMKRDGKDVEEGRDRLGAGGARHARTR